jgi:hypothetical protein
VPITLAILNLDTARFDCTFGRGCDGVCCREGKPPVYPDEVERLAANLDRMIPLLRPQAAAIIRRLGFTQTRRRAGLQKLRNAGGWCVFFNKGCTLHQLGADEGNPFKYKPAACALFPLDKDHHDRWYIRQKGYKGEIWDLPCLNPANTSRKASDTLAGEIRLAQFHSAPRS